MSSQEIGNAIIGVIFLVIGLSGLFIIFYTNIKYNRNKKK